MNPAEEFFDIPFEKLVEANVMTQEIKDDMHQEDKQKLTNFTLKLTGEELASIIRKAGVAGKPWKQFLEDEIRSTLFEQKIGKPLISAPSIGGGKVTGPSNPKYQERIHV